MRLINRKQPHGRLIYSSLLFTIVLVFYGGVLLLWTKHCHYYIAIMNALGVNAWNFPFLDTMGELSWIDCHRQGIDVFGSNPCDPLNRLFNYSPILLDLPDIGLRVRDTFAIGFGIALAFLATLPYVLRPASFHALVLASIACLSPAVDLAMERGSCDSSPLCLAHRPSGVRLDAGRNPLGVLCDLSCGRAF